MLDKTNGKYKMDLSQRTNFPHQLLYFLKTESDIKVKKSVYIANRSYRFCRQYAIILL